MLKNTIRGVVCASSAAALAWHSAVAATDAAAPATAAAAPAPIRLLAEAEDFTPKGEGWSVLPFRENYYASTFAITFLSRLGCLSAPEQVPAGKRLVAEQEVDIPYADEFQLLARYEQPYNFSCEFTVEVEQAGTILAALRCGRLEDPKIWPMNGHKRVAMERYWWGGTDNILWQNPGSVKLTAGKATLRLVAAAQMDGAKPRVNAAKRHVDVISLTNDKAGMEAQKQSRYLEFDGWLVQAGDLYVRITNPKDGLGPCVPLLAPAPSGQHSPYYIHTRDWKAVRVLKSGWLAEPAAYLNCGPRTLAVRPDLLGKALDAAAFSAAADPKKPKAAPTPQIPEAEYLQPGDRSGWVPLGQMLDALHDCVWAPGAEYRGKPGKEIDLAFEFAIPDGTGGLKTVKELRVKGATGNGANTFVFPGNLAPNPALEKALKERWWLPQIRTQVESLAWLKSEVDKFPKRGSVAKRFLIYSIGGFGSTAGFPEGRDLMLALGDNTVVNQKGNKRALVAHWRETDAAAIQKRDVTDVKVISYGDEMHLPAVPVTDADFATWLRARGVTYDGPVQFNAKDRTNPLYYYSTLCGVEQGAKPYVDATAYYQGQGALTGANYSPHANYLVSEMHWVRPFKLNALSMAWSEDYVWQIPEFSVQVVGYMMTAFRCGVKYHGQPIMMYVMPHSPGNTPGDFRRAFYTNLAHGMRLVNYFCGSPLATGGTENYVATDDLAMWREIYNVSHDAGTFEDYVMDGQVRPARVGILLSSVDDVMTGASNSTLALHNNERKALYYALRHSQVPVDMLSEDDVIDGLAKDCQVLYVTQQWMHSKCLAALQKWTAAGGTVVALCGGGFTDEFNRPNPQANAFYGVKSQQLSTDPQLVSKYLLKENTPFLTKQDLPLYEPLDTVAWTGAGGTSAKDVPVIVWKQALEPDDGKVVGTFRDGKPAIIRKDHGQGKVLLFGFLPGQAYLRSGLPVRPADRGATDSAYAHFLPTGMDTALRQRLVDDFLPAGFVRPVVCSEPLVESACIDTVAGGKLGIPLINYTGKPIAKLTVRIPGLTAAKSVRTLESGILKPTFANGAMTVELPLAIADMLLVDR